MSDAVRSGEPVILAAVQEVEERYPWLGSKDIPYESLAVWPLSLPSQRVGAVQLTFTAPPDADDLRADVTGVAAVLALYLSLLTSSPVRRGQVGSAWTTATTGRRRSPRRRCPWSSPSNADEPTPAALRRPAPGTLTDRQLRILGLMAKGLTNSQISKRVGFSESTVRQETMAIYRYFGVGGRREAVRLAGMRGMLDANAG